MELGLAWLRLAIFGGMILAADPAAAEAVKAFPGAEGFGAGAIGGRGGEVHQVTN